MIVVGRFYCYTRDDLDDHFGRLQPNCLNLDLPGAAHLDHESKVITQPYWKKDQSPEQMDTKEIDELRSGNVTASNFYRICQCLPILSEKKFYRYQVEKLAKILKALYFLQPRNDDSLAGENRNK